MNRVRYWVILILNKIIPRIWKQYTVSIYYNGFISNQKIYPWVTCLLFHMCVNKGHVLSAFFFFFFSNKCSRNRNFVPWLTPQNSVLLPTSLFFWREGREIIPEKRIILALEQLNIRDEIQNKCYTASRKFNCSWGLETCLIVSRILHSLILRGSQINILLIACL